MKSHTVELFKRVSNFPVRRGQSRIHRDTFHLRGSTGATDLHTGAFLDVAKVNGVSTTALVGDHGRFHVANKSPLCLAEERMGFDIRSSGSSSKTFCLVFNQQFTDYGFAEAKGTSVSLCASLRGEKRCNLLGDLLCSCMFRELNFIPQDIGESGIAILSLERRCPIQHLKDQDAQSPPVDSAGVATTFDNLGGNVLFRTNERVRSEIRNARLGVDGR